jgi:hypothetical protein
MNTEKFYPDVVAHGGLANAVGAALREIGSPLPATELDKAVRFVAYARVESGKRLSQIYMAAQERLFMFDFWSRGVDLAKGKTKDLIEMARAIDKWIGSNCTAAELANAFLFVEASSAASAYESGEIVELRWQQYLASLSKDHPKLRAFITAAAAEPKLRQLFPYTSLDNFCFSRCTGYPFTRDTPRIVPLGDDKYEVITFSGTSLGRGGPIEAIAIVVAHLPPGCGPALPGTSDDLAAG